VSAAASLTDAFKEIGTAFEARNPGAKVTFNFGSSSTLQTQLTQGAKAEVFASADQTQMDKAVQGGAISGTPKVFATNRLTIIVPSDNPKRITTLQDLAKPGVKVVAAQTGVPVGQYTDQILAKASKDPAYEADFQSKVQANFVSRESDVRQVVSKIALGEGDAAVVYTTDVTPQSAPKLKTIAIPDALNVIAVYPIATVKSGTNQAGGTHFVDFVLSPDGQKIMAKWGFGPPTA
jgi:molybdate transport system substrate-binding protein